MRSVNSLVKQVKPSRYFTVLHVLFQCYHPRTLHGNCIRSHFSVCLSVSLSVPCRNFWKPCPRDFIFIFMYILRIFRSRSYIKVRVAAAKSVFAYRIRMPCVWLKDSLILLLFYSILESNWTICFWWANLLYLSAHNKLTKTTVTGWKTEREPA